MSSRVDESESERAFGGVALALLLLWVGIVAGLWWLSRQPGDVVGRLVAAGFVVLGMALIGLALGRLEQR